MINWRDPENIVCAVASVAFYFFLAWCSWQPLDAHHPKNDRAEDYCAYTCPKQESLSTPADDRIFGWQAISVFTGLLFVATVGLGIVTGWGIRNQIKDTRIIQRAYITTIPRGTRRYHIVGSSLDDLVACNVEFKNVGHLAAQRMKFRVKHLFDESFTREEFPDLKNECVGNIVLAPEIGMMKGATDPPTRAEFYRRRDAVTSESPAGWLYVFGRAEYWDGFQNRWMEFCFRYSLAAANSEGRISEEDARYHEHGNRTDEG